MKAIIYFYLLIILSCIFLMSSLIISENKKSEACYDLGYRIYDYYFEGGYIICKELVGFNNITGENEYIYHKIKYEHGWLI